MLLDSSKWSDAYEMAKRTMRPDEIENLFVSKAETEAEKSNFKVAEELFILCDKEDLAISMYKKEKRWDEMIKLGSFSRYCFCHVTRCDWSVSDRSIKQRIKTL